MDTAFISEVAVAVLLGFYFVVTFTSATSGYYIITNWSIWNIVSTPAGFLILGAIVRCFWKTSILVGINNFFEPWSTTIVFMAICSAIAENIIDFMRYDLHDRVLPHWLWFILSMAMSTVELLAVIIVVVE